VSAAPAYSPAPERRSVEGGWAAIPNVLIQNAKHLTYAEFLFACIVARRADQDGLVTDAMWQEWTGMTPKSRENAERGLRAHKLVIGDKPNRYGLDVRSFSGWARHANPADRRTAGRGPSAPPVDVRLHRECKNQCAMAAGRAQLIPLDATEVAKQVSSVSSVEASRENGASKPQGRRVDPPAPHFLGEEAGWSKTLEAMRSAFATAGTALLMRLVAIVLALFPDVTDSELAAAVGVVIRERGASMRGPALFLDVVPEALANLRRIRAKPLDSIPVTKPVSAEALREAEEKAGRFALWDRICGRHKGPSGYDMRAIADDPEMDSLGKSMAEGMIKRLGRFTAVAL